MTRAGGTPLPLHSLWGAYGVCGVEVCSIFADPFCLRVTFTSLDPGTAKDLPKDPRLRVQPGDITDPAQCEKLVDEAHE